MAGVVGRSFLERLRLLTVPRLSIILTMVILCVVFGVSILYYMLPEVITEAVLLPMVILTMFIERFHVTMEEDGLVFTLQLAAGTLMVAVLVYLCWDGTKSASLCSTIPKSHFFTIAAFILLGRYAGYRLTELWRFRDLVEHERDRAMNAAPSPAVCLAPRAERAGVLGINHRNLAFIQESNPRAALSARRRQDDHQRHLPRARHPSARDLRGHPPLWRRAAFSR